MRKGKLGTEGFDVFPGLRIEDQRAVAQRFIESGDVALGAGRRQVGLGENDHRFDRLQFGEG